MKKSLLAVAAIGAFASAAQAQSSVTVYGIMDVGLVGANSRQAYGTAPAAGNLAAGVVKSTSAGIASGAESTSRFGLKGSEDLGGGLSAFFTIEQKIDPDQAGTALSTSTGDRQTFVGLKKNGLGDFALGTQYTIVHQAVAVTDAGQQNNIVGNLIYTGATGAATISKLAGTATLATAQNASGMVAGTSYTIRQSNALTLNTDTFGGFKGHLMLTQNNLNQTQNTTAGTASDGGNTNSSGWGIGADYTWKKLFLTANYQAFTARNTSSVTTTNNMVLFGTGQGNTTGTNVNDNQQYYAATYDFGILKAYAQYVSRSSTQNNNSAVYQKYNAEQIGVRSFVTPVVEVFASGGYGNFTNAGVSNPKANLAAYQLGSNYWLSKRTNLYAIYGQTSTSNVASTAAPTVFSSFNQNNYAVGVRHTF